MEIISVYLKSTHTTRKLVKSAGQLYLAVGSLREDKKLEQGELGVQTDVTWRAKTALTTVHLLPRSRCWTTRA